MEGSRPRYAGTAMLRAAEFGHVPVVELLLDDSNAAEMSERLVCAASAGQLEVVKRSCGKTILKGVELLVKASSLEANAESLVVAAQRKHTNIFGILLENSDRKTVVRALPNIAIDGISGESNLILERSDVRDVVFAEAAINGFAELIRKLQSEMESSNIIRALTCAATRGQTDVGEK
ncbi:unnamed protein product [Phytophthora lilii]|uniref:Unnamed protein product n=1 Tax=Phytophthora lilii TaxID=2077276 RepID=A0A9W7CMZ3_9STRA|nr:unnamed protein product [Phytophthora lilii]